MNERRALKRAGDGWACLMHCPLSLHLHLTSAASLSFCTSSALFLTTLGACGGRSGWNVAGLDGCDGIHLKVSHAKLWCLACSPYAVQHLTGGMAEGRL